MSITEVIELIPKENWVKVNRIPQKTEYDTTKDKKQNHIVKLKNKQTTFVFLVDFFSLRY